MESMSSMLNFVHWEPSIKKIWSWGLSSAAHCPSGNLSVMLWQCHSWAAFCSSSRRVLRTMYLHQLVCPPWRYWYCTMWALWLLRDLHWADCRTSPKAFWSTKLLLQLRESWSNSTSPFPVWLLSQAGAQVCHCGYKVLPSTFRVTLGLYKNVCPCTPVSWKPI